MITSIVKRKIRGRRKFNKASRKDNRTQNNK